MQRGLITANGGYLTKHSFGVYGTEPPEHEFRWEDVQAEVDAEPTRKAEVEWSGVGTVETWTTPFDRDGSAGEGVRGGAHPGRRAHARGDHRRRRSRCDGREDIAGAKVQVHADGTANLE